LYIAFLLENLKERNGLKSPGPGPGLGDDDDDDDDDNVDIEAIKSERVGWIHLAQYWDK
jgi:hypothetical protein